MARRDDDTVIIRQPGPAQPLPGQPRPKRRGTAARAAATLGAVAVSVAALGAAGLAWFWRPAAPPGPALPLASEAELRAESPAARTVLRFAPNPAIIVVDFPTLAEQGLMLNRLAAWEEKAGVPHDRLLDDAELEAVIRQSGATSATYYYGHDYRSADVARFFAQADRQHLALNPQERDLRALVANATAEPLGLGAIITLPRADAANEVDPAMRATILHHELSHGEYFTNPIYASFVRTVWDTVYTDAERAAWRTYLSTEGYDPGIEDLMVNESQAYLMHTADPRFFDPARLGIPPARLLQIRQSFVAGMPSCWLRDETTAGEASPALTSVPVSAAQSATK